MPYFSEYFKVSPDVITEYGAVDISLICDLPLFVDPMLIFNSDKPAYQELHKSMIRYYTFLYKKAEEKPTQGTLKAWFTFNEIPNNWLGYSVSGNKGSALGSKYAQFLFDNIGFAVRTNDISISPHIEKAMLLYKGSGKDKISDLTVNLIKGYLCSYTENFAKNYISSNYCTNFFVDRASFNYRTESFESLSYYLPYIECEDGKREFVLLTPSDILRSGESAINRNDLIRNNQRVRESIENNELRTIVNNYIGKAIAGYIEVQQRNNRPPNEKTLKGVEANAFEEMLQAYPIIFDYYVAQQERDIEQIRVASWEEYTQEENKYIIAAKHLINLCCSHWHNEVHETATEESKARIKWMKHIIEDCDGYKDLYRSDGHVAKEKELQRIFQYVWYDTKFKLDAEVNNGRGQADFIVSKGKQNQSVIEFKLASNPKLDHVFKQVEIYKTANDTKDSLIVIFFFTEKEYEKSIRVIENAKCRDQVDDTIYLIDCRNDNKVSASVG